MNFAKSFHHSIVVTILLLSSGFVWANDGDSSPTTEPLWIWTPVQQAGSIPTGACFFRRTFEVTRRSTATLEIAADDSFEVYVNGQFVGQGSGWAHLTKLDISNHVQVGKNAIAVKVVNRSPGHAGLVTRIDLGRDASVLSDASWKTSSAPLPKWKQLRFADKSWRPASPLGEWNKTEPWIIRKLPSARRVARSASSKPIRIEEESDDSKVVLASAEEAVDQAEKPQPLLLRPIAQTTPQLEKSDTIRPRWSTDSRLGGPQEIQNPFVKKRRTVATPTNVKTPEVSETVETVEDSNVPPNVQPIPDVQPKKVFHRHAPCCCS